jgi:hypothetical protein
LLHLLLLVVSTSVIRVVAVHAEATVRVALAADAVASVAVAQAVVPVAEIVQAMVAPVQPVAAEVSPAVADVIATNRFILGTPKPLWFGGSLFAGCY